MLLGGDAATGRKAVSPATARRIFATLRAALNAAVRQRRLIYTPCQGVELPSEPRSEMKVWNAEQVRAFLTAAEGDRLAVLFRLCLLRGLRRGEACGLRWRDADFAASVLHIRQAAVCVGSVIELGPRKTLSGERTVSLDAGTLAALKAHRKVQNEERLAWAGAYDENDLVFARPDGTVERPNQATRRFGQIAKATGLLVIRLHDARHTAISLALEAGASMKEAQDLAGHSTYVLTANTYAHVSPETRTAGGDRVAALVDGPRLRAV